MQRRGWKHNHLKFVDNCYKVCLRFSNTLVCRFFVNAQGLLKYSGKNNFPIELIFIYDLVMECLWIKKKR